MNHLHESMDCVFVFTTNASGFTIFRIHDSLRSRNCGQPTVGIVRPNKYVLWVLAWSCGRLAGNRAIEQSYPCRADTRIDVTTHQPRQTCGAHQCQDAGPIVGIASLMSHLDSARNTIVLNRT